MSIIKSTSWYWYYRCASLIEKPVKVRHGPAAVTWSVSCLCHWKSIWEGKICEEAKPEELPVRYIVVWPARDGERCRESKAMGWFALFLYDISPFFKSPACIRLVRVLWKAVFCFYLLLGSRDGCDLRRSARAIDVFNALVHGIGHTVFFKSHSQIFLLAESISFLLSGAAV